MTFIAEQQVAFIIVAGDFSPLSEAYPNYYAKAGYVVGSEKEVDTQGIYFVMGNHDGEPYGDIFFRENMAPHYPENGPYGAPEGTIYSFDRGNAHFLITNQYWNYRKGGYTDEQLNWIEQDLQSSQQRFKFVIGHEPVYPIDRHVGDSLDEDPAMRDTFWEILSDNGVQAFFCGHTHHLSIIKNQGVYQIDSGEVVSDHISVSKMMKKIALFVLNGLKEAGFAVDHITNGEDGLHMALNEPYDLAIIDLMLPKLDGLSLIEKIRRNKVSTPVLILSARRTVDDRVKGLKTGGDDYLTKLFAFSELLARVRALVRRATQTTSPSSLTVEDLAINLQTRKVERNDRKIDLQPLEYSLLEYLMRNAGHVVSKTMIMEHVWDYNFNPQTNVVESRICYLRDKIDKGFNKKLIHTIRGVGYVLKPDD